MIDEARDRRIFGAVRAEMHGAEERFGPFTSSHEGYGVLVEEVAELLDAIRANDAEAVEREAVQVSAVAARIAGACSHGPFRERSGFTRLNADAE